MTEILCEFWASEEGEPFAAFVFGHVPIETVATDAIRERIMREADVWDLEAETLDSVREIMQAEPAHLWVHQKGKFEDSPFYFCNAEDKGAEAITGWKLC